MGKKKTKDQLIFEMCLNTSNYVVQSNNLIGGKQALKLNSAKLIRAAIMQVVKEDEELRPYVITITELSELLNVPASNLYRDIEDITDDILKNPVYIKSENQEKVIWIKIPWVSRCEYQSDIGVAIKLNDELKPFLIDLKERYTQYTLDNVLAMKSVYAIRIFEILQQKVMIRLIPHDGIDIELSVKEIRECCNCEDKYGKFSHLKSRVLDVATNEINQVTMYTLNYSYIKKARTVVGIMFHMNMKYH